MAKTTKKPAVKKTAKTETKKTEAKKTVEAKCHDREMHEKFLKRVHGIVTKCAMDAVDAAVECGICARCGSIEIAREMNEAAIAVVEGLINHLVDQIDKSES